MPFVPSGPGLWPNLTKQTASEELARAVKQVLTGRMYVTASLGESMPAARARIPPVPTITHCLSENSKSLYC